MVPTARFFLGAVAGLCLCGCGGPNKANIGLRQENQSLRQRLDQAVLERDAERARVRALEASAGTLPTLPQERLQRLFTAHALQIGRLSGPADFDPAAPGDDGVKVYVVPVDEQNQPVKMSGAFTVELFDLSADAPRLGRWDFDVDAARGRWFGRAMLYEYVLECPWQRPAPSGPMTLRVTFVDELTRRVLTAQREIAPSPAPVAATGG